MEIASERTTSFAATPVIEDNHTLSIGVIEPQKYVYVSPIYYEKPGNAMSRAHIKHERSLLAREERDEKDLEIEMLKEELHRQHHEIQGQVTRLRSLRPSEIEEEKSDVSDKFVDKVNTIKNSRYPGDKLHSKVESIKSRLFSAISTENAPGFQNSPKNNGDLHSSFRRRNLVPTVPTEILQEDIVSVRRGRGESTFPDSDRPALLQDCSEVTMKVQETLSTCFSSIQLSLENLHNKIKLHDIRYSDSSRSGNEEIEDELFILEKTFAKLKEIWQEPSDQGFPCKTMNHQMDGENVGFQNIINRMNKKLSSAEQKITVLEASCNNKSKQIGKLEACIQAMLKDKDAEIEKYEIASALRETCKEGTKQRSGISTVLSLADDKVTNHFKAAKARYFNKKATYSEATDNMLSERFYRNVLQQNNESLTNQNEILKLRLSWAEFQLAQQEATLKRLMSILHSGIEHSSDQSEDELSCMMSRADLQEVKRKNSCIDELEESHQSIEAERPEDVRTSGTYKFLEEVEFKIRCMNTEVSKHIRDMRELTNVF